MQHFSNADVANDYHEMSYEVMNLGPKLKRIMRQRKVSQESLGRSVDVSQSQAGKWVNNKNIPDAMQLSLIAETLKIPADYLIDDGRPIVDAGELDREMQIRELIRKFGIERSYHRITGVESSLVQPSTLAGGSWAGTLTDRQIEILRLADVVGEEEVLDLLRRSGVPAGLPIKNAASVLSERELDEKRRDRQQK